MKAWTLTLPRAMNHGDHKSAQLHPDRWPELKAGTEITVTGGSQDFYGYWLHCVTKDGKTYDLDSSAFGAEGRRVVREIREYERSQENVSDR